MNLPLDSEPFKFTEEQLKALTTTMEPPPRDVDAEIKGELIKAIGYLFPSIGLFLRTIATAKEENRNVIIPVVFTCDGKVLIQEPIVIKSQEVAPKPEEKGAEEKGTDGAAPVSA